MREVIVSLAVEREGVEIALDAYVTLYELQWGDRLNTPTADVMPCLGEVRWDGRLTDEEADQAIHEARSLDQCSRAYALTR